MFDELARMILQSATRCTWMALQAEDPIDRALWQLSAWRWMDLLREACEGEPQ